MANHDIYYKFLWIMALGWGIPAIRSGEIIIQLNALPQIFDFPIKLSTVQNKTFFFIMEENLL